MDIFSGFIWLVIIGAFIYPFAKTVVQKRAAPPPGRPPVGGPRDLFESGGYEPSREARPDPRGARPDPRAARPDPREGRRMPPRAEIPSEAARSIRGAPEPQPAVWGTGRVDGRQVRAQLRNPGSVRAAVVLREVLDRPASMR